MSTAASHLRLSPRGLRMVEILDVQLADLGGTTTKQFGGAADVVPQARLQWWIARTHDLRLGDDDATSTRQRRRPRLT